MRAILLVKLLTPQNVLNWMPTSSCFRAGFKSELVHESQTLLISAGDKFYPNFPLLREKPSQKDFSESDPKCYDCLWRRWRPITRILLIHERNSWDEFKRKYLKNLKEGVKIFLDFGNLHEIMHRQEKKNMNLIAQIFRKLLTSNYVLTWMPKKLLFQKIF